MTVLVYLTDYYKKILYIKLSSKNIDNEPHLTWNSMMSEFIPSLTHSYKLEPYLQHDEIFINNKEKEYSKFLFIVAS